MSLEGRVKRLEAWTRPPGGRCEECKFPPGAPGRIVYFDKGLPEDPDERCPGCGRRLWFVIEVVGAGAEADTGGGGHRWP